jgi:hypothetical protein
MYTCSYNTHVIAYWTKSEYIPTLQCRWLPGPTTIRMMARGGGFGGEQMMAFQAPVNALASSAQFGNSAPQPENLQEVERVRKIFPETWLWTTTTTG